MIKSVEEIRREQDDYGQERNKTIISTKKKKKQARITPQMSSTLDKASIDFVKDMALFYSHKKRRLYTYSQTLRVLLSYCRDMEHKLQEFI